MTTLEWRAFTALLQRISPDDKELKQHFIPVSELIDVTTGGGKAYAQIVELSKLMTKRTLNVEMLGPDGERVKNPDIEITPLLARASYVEKRGGLVLILNPLFAPYLLQLSEKGNFTKSRAAEFKQIRSSHAFKLYWLLSEYRAFGSRTFTEDELRSRLGITEKEYVGRFNNFRARVLDKAQEELAKTDMAFTVDLIRVGKVLAQIKFTFKAGSRVKALPSATKTPSPPPSEFPAWATPLLAIGLSEEACQVIARHLGEGQYPTEYLAYVLIQAQKPRKDKIRKVADYVYKCVTGKLLLGEYERSLESPVSLVRKPAPKPRTKAPTLVPEQVLPLAEIRNIYDNPGPFAKRQERAATFEEHLELIYLSQGFVREVRDGQEVVILPAGFEKR